MSRMSVIDSSVDLKEDGDSTVSSAIDSSVDAGEGGGTTGNAGSSGTIVPVICISSEELKAFYNNEHSAHKETRRALKTAKEENKKLKTELGNKKERDSKWLRFHENQAEAEKKVSNAAEPKSPFKIKPIR